jgi:hypothetical protein
MTKLQTHSAGMRAPDPILAELWEVKRQLNQEAGYDVARRAKAAHKAAQAILKQISKAEPGLKGA